MSRRVLFAVLVLLGTSGRATAHHRRRAPSNLVLKDRGAPSSNLGAKVDSQTVIALAPLAKASTFVDRPTARVENDLMLFQPTLVGVAPSARARTPELFASGPVKKETRFYTPAKVTDDLEVRREHDRVLLFRGPQPQGASVGLGLAMFGAMTLLSAHAPRSLRIVFDGPVHLGPAVFDGGGMGAGIAGRGF